MKLPKKPWSERTVSACSAVSGAGLNPQFPTTSVVTPWWILLSPPGQRKSERSEWVCMSMKPGQTTRPTRVDPLPGRRAAPRSPIAAMRPCRMPTSAR
jgi:hypothetical protein